uniref:SGNH hydrolase-type esterase domain-containing protein n=1 Tax=Leptobrachium leishanense TaxID=445787 RepID=A0A8C5QPI5_9ANUR
MSVSKLEGLTQCTSCCMYACLEESFQGPYLCSKCERVALLEARIGDLEGQIVTLRQIDNLERSLLLTEQSIVEESRGVGGVELTGEQVGSWVSVTRGSRGGGKRKRLASPDLAHTNRFAPLSEDVGCSSSGVAVLEAAPSNSRGISPPSKGGIKRASKPRQVVVVGDSIIKRVDRVICRADRLNRTVCCLPGARVRHVVDRVDRLLGGAGDDPAVMVHIGTNDKVSGRWKDLKNDFRELGSKLKKRSSKVVFSEILPVPRATVERQREIREVNAWLKAWCRKEGFGFLEHWAHFALGYNLYSCDRLHLNGRGSAVLGERMVKRLEETLN